jgi:hypothetical protein
VFVKTCPHPLGLALRVSSPDLSISMWKLFERHISVVDPSPVFVL